MRYRPRPNSARVHAFMEGPKRNTTSATSILQELLCLHARPFNAVGPQAAVTEIDIALVEQCRHNWFTLDDRQSTPLAFTVLFGKETLSVNVVLT